MAVPLQNLKVIDLTQGIAGPTCSMDLGDLGAEVIKVEPLEGDYSRQLGPPFVAGESALFLSVNRNKKSLALDWETTQGQEIVRKLVKDADIFLEDMKPGTADSLGLGYRELAKANPGLIYCSITPFGPKGPMSQQAGSELVAQGVSGYWRYMGNLGEPPIRVGQDLVTTDTGIFTFHAILAALIHRQGTGKGQRVETSLLGSISAIKTILFAAQSDPPEWSGFLLEGPFVPSDHGYKTKDGAAYVRFGGRVGRSKTRPEASTQEDWQAFMIEVGMEDYLDDPRFAGGMGNMMGVASVSKASEVHAILDQAFQKYTTEELAVIAHKYGGEVLPFNDYESLFKHPQAEAMEIVKQIDHPTAGKLQYIAPPWNFEKCEVATSSPPPLLGQHTLNILQSLNYSKKQIDKLRQDGVIWAS